MKKLLIVMFLGITLIGCAKVKEAPQTEIDVSTEVTEHEVYGVVTPEGTCILVVDELEENECQTD